MKPIYYINRLTGEVEEEKVYGASGIRFLYGDDVITRVFGAPLLHTLVKTSFFSALYGFWQKLSLTKRKVKPFIDAFSVDTTEFADDPDSFSSFNSFFTRHLKPEARPISPGNNIAVIPADGRYFFYQDIKRYDGFTVKEKKFSLSSLLQSNILAEEYEGGSMAIARLCPSDYHRFHFPCAGIPSPSRLINGALYSVNPWAIKKDISIFAKNKRTLCEIDTEAFGKVLYMEVGATCVGSIHQTYQPGKQCLKGEEKGYFSFGGSTLILLFLPNTIKFDDDLLDATQLGLEIRCLLGQPMGKSPKMDGLD